MIVTPQIRGDSVPEEKELDRDKEKSPSPKGRAGCIAAALAAVLLLGAVGTGAFFYQLERPSGRGSITLDIRKDMTGADIGSLLEEKGIISHASVFRAALMVSGDGSLLKSGHYRMKKGMTVAEVTAALKKGQNDFRTVTIPEGMTAAQMADRLAAAGLPAGDDFFRTASTYGPLTYMYGPEAAIVKGEGFLFPDTYDIPVDYTARQVCDMMYRRMDEILTPERRERAKEKHMTLHQLITIASMVEKEARWEEDQVPIASVIFARLAAGMPLQIDATVQYVLGDPKENLTAADTRMPSPYNTYLRTGLPPGPIASPGENAIDAVLSASPGEYLYYVARPDGHHLFARTYAEHRANIGAVYGTN